MHVTTKSCSCCSVAKWCLTLCDPWPEACQASLSFLISWSLLKLTPFNHLILCHPLLILLSIFPRIRVFSNELTLCIRWPKYWSFSISPANEYSGLISFRVDWFDLLAVQGTLKTVSQTRQLHSHGKGTRRSREPWWRGHYNSRWWPHKLWRQLFQSRFCSSFMASVSQLGLSLRSADAAPLESKWVWGCSFASGPLSPGADCIELRQKMEFPLPASLKELSKFTSLTEAIGAEFSLEQ